MLYLKCCTALCLQCLHFVHTDTRITETRTPALVPMQSLHAHVVVTSAVLKLLATMQTALPSPTVFGNLALHEQRTRITGCLQMREPPQSSLLFPLCLFICLQRRVTSILTPVSTSERCMLSVRRLGTVLFHIAAFDKGVCGRTAATGICDAFLFSLDVLTFMSSWLCAD